MVGRPLQGGFQERVGAVDLAGGLKCKRQIDFSLGPFRTKLQSALKACDGFGRGSTLPLQVAQAKPDGGSIGSALYETLADSFGVRCLVKTLQHLRKAQRELFAIRPAKRCGLIGGASSGEIARLPQNRTEI